jgi:hypothetical protein
MAAILIACGSLVLYYVLDIVRYDVSRDSF